MDKRAAFWFPTNVEADCRSSNRSWVSRMRNISTTGCMIACPDDDLPGGALLRMRIKGLTAIDGEIVWLHRGHAGVRFRIPIHPALMERLAFQNTDRGYDAPPIVREPQTAAVPRRALPGLNGQLVKRALPAGDPEARQASAA